MFEKRLHGLDVTFDHDFDSDRYMFSKDPAAKGWTVIIHCKDGSQHEARAERFSPYPGCPTHEGETAWGVDRYKADKIEVQRPGQTSVTINHPDRNL